MSQIVSFTERTPCSAILCHEPLPRARTASGYLGHFRSLAQASALPIIVEHNQSSIPDVSDALVQLAMDPNVCGIVEATGDVALNGELIRKTPDNFFILTSRDVMMLPLMALGIDGAVSTIANAFPQECSEMMGQMAFGNFQDAQSTHHALAPLLRILELEGGVGHQGHPQPLPRIGKFGAPAQYTGLGRDPYGYLQGISRLASTHG